MDDADVGRRALAAYYRSGGTDPPAGGGDVTEHEGKLYVVLQGARGTLAVYRIRGSGALRRMKRWPREVAPRDLQIRKSR
jgi:hypothetical protein